MTFLLTDYFSSLVFCSIRANEVLVVFIRFKCLFSKVCNTDPCFSSFFIGVEKRTQLSRVHIASLFTSLLPSCKALLSDFLLRGGSIACVQGREKTTGRSTYCTNAVIILRPEETRKEAWGWWFGRCEAFFAQPSVSSGSSGLGDEQGKPVTPTPSLCHSTRGFGLPMKPCQLLGQSVLWDSALLYLWGRAAKWGDSSLQNAWDRDAAAAAAAAMPARTQWMRLQYKMGEQQHVRKLNKPNKLLARTWWKPFGCYHVPHIKVNFSNPTTLFLMFWATLLVIPSQFWIDCFIWQDITAHSRWCLVPYLKEFISVWWLIIYAIT